VVFDASTGKVLISPSVLQALQSSPVYVVSGAVQATLAAAQRLLQLAGQVSSVQTDSARVPHSVLPTAQAHCSTCDPASALQQEAIQAAIAQRGIR
jgi:hypothetical protein